MLFDEYKQIVPGQTKVICHTRSTDMPGGWNPHMDEMVGKVYIVHQTGDKRVWLQYSDDYIYSFDHRYVELYREAFIPIVWRQHKFMCVSEIHLRYLKEKTLSEDLSKLSKIIDAKGKSSITVTPDILENIQNNCPRVIGVLLSNNLIKRVTH